MEAVDYVGKEEFVSDSALVFQSISTDRDYNREMSREYFESRVKDIMLPATDKRQSNCGCDESSFNYHVVRQNPNLYALSNHKIGKCTRNR